MQPLNMVATAAAMRTGQLMAIGIELMQLGVNETRLRQQLLRRSFALAREAGRSVPTDECTAVLYSLTVELLRGTGVLVSYCVCSS